MTQTIPDPDRYRHKTPASTLGFPLTESDHARIEAAKREIAAVALLMDRVKQTSEILSNSDTLVAAHHRQTDKFITRQLSKYL